MYSKVEGQYGEMTEIETNGNGNFYVSFCGLYGEPHILVFDEAILDLTNKTAAPVPVEKYSNANDILARIAKLKTNACFHWETPEYRLVALELGYNPDNGRPLYAKEHFITGHKLSVIAYDHSGTTSEQDRRFAVSLIMLLRTDSPRVDIFEYLNCLDYLDKGPTTSLLLSAWSMVQAQRSGDPQYDQDRIVELRKTKIQA